MKTYKIGTIFSIVAAGAMFAACGEMQAGDKPPLIGVENETYPEGAPVTYTGNLEQNWQVGNSAISFSNGQYSGNTGCNSFSGSYTMTGADTVRIEPMALTKKICFDNKLMQDEANFAQNFPGDYKLVNEGQSVVLLNDQRSWILATGVN